jgi:hypothetical protein
MAERDPFGRLPDENPLAGLGSLSDGTTSQAAEAVVVEAKDDWSGAEPASRRASAAELKAAVSEARTSMSDAAKSAAAASPRTGNPALDQSLAEVIRQAETLSGVKVVQSARVVGRVVKLVVFLIVVGVLASVAGSLVDAGKDVRDAVGDLPSPREIADGGTPPGAARATPVGLASGSMLRRRNFDRAMKRLRTSGLGRMRSLSIRPDRIDAQLLTKGGSLRSVQVRFDDRAIKDFGAGGAGFGHLETIPFARIDTAAPARLARSAAGRARLPVSRVDYVVLGASQGTVTWNAYMKAGGGYFAADSRGRITRRIG